MRLRLLRSQGWLLKLVAPCWRGIYPDLMKCQTLRWGLRIQTGTDGPALTDMFPAGKVEEDMPTCKQPRKSCKG